jgi:AraC-like DNA-binding protein
MLSYPALPPSVQVQHHPIPNRLAPFIERAVTLNFVGAVGLRWHLVPTGCVGLTLMLGDPANDFELQAGAFRRTLTGMLHRAVGRSCDRPNVALSLALTPLAAAQLPMQAYDFSQSLSAQVEELFCRDLSARLYRLAHDARTLDAKMRALLQWVEQVLFDRRPTHGRQLAIGEVATLMRSLDAPSLADAARRVGVSPRQFERDFQRYLGATPRRYAQVAKVQQMAQLVWRGHSLADTAAALCFADQAHMTRVVHDVTGLPPATLLRRARASPFAQASGPWRTLRLTHV